MKNPFRLFVFIPMSNFCLRITDIYFRFISLILTKMTATETEIFQGMFDTTISFTQSKVYMFLPQQFLERREVSTKERKK